MRVPVHSLAGLLQVDFRMPGSTDYTTLLRATRLLTRDERGLKAYARAVFNALFHNQDDHPKNFAWRLGQDRRWRLAPAFDLTFSDGPMGQHHMDVCGEGAAVGRDHLLRLARRVGWACPWQKPRSTGWLSWRRPTPNAPRRFRFVAPRCGG